MSKIVNNLKIFESFKKNNNSLDKLFGKIESFANQLKCDANYDLCLNSVKMCKTIDEFNESENKKRFKCFWPKCQYLTEFESQLNRHIFIHSNERPFVCDFKDCNQTFKRDVYLIDHKLTHFKTEDNKKLKCFWPKCYFKTDNKQTLTQHISKHSNARKFPCKIPGCNYSNKYKNYLKKHMKKHSNLRQFFCDFKECNKTFKYKSTLNLHKRRHNERKSFKCDFKDCDKSYLNSVSLKSHQMSAHLNIRYRCDYSDCNKTFGRKQQFFNHKRKHSGEKPFKCDINGCTQGFRVKSQLKFHQKNKKLHSKSQTIN